MEQDVIEKVGALVGVAFHDKVIFNIVENDGEFFNTGLSIVHHLKNDKNKFMAKIIESQSYNSIRYIFDDKMCFSSFYSKDNQNKESYEDILHIINDENGYEHFYIFDVESNTLIIKIPQIDKIFALDYTSSHDVRDIINTIK